MYWGLPAGRRSRAFCGHRERSSRRPTCGSLCSFFCIARTVTTPCPHRPRSAALAPCPFVRDDGKVTLMNENAAAALSVICADYRASFVPPSFGNGFDWTAAERANRGFIAIGLAGQNALFRGAERILEHLDALCRVACVKEVVLLAKHPLMEDLAPRSCRPPT